MSELPVVAPGEIVASAHINDIADRTVQRYADQATLDLQNPTPTEGELAFLESDLEGVFGFKLYDGAVWQPVIMSITGQLFTIARSSTNMTDLHNLNIADSLQPGKVRVRVSEVTGYTIQTGSRNGAVALSNAMELTRDAVKFIGIGGARLALERSGVAFQWRFAIGSSGDLLLQSSSDGTTYNTVETWVGV